MAVDDLDALREELPDLFSDRDLPAAWEEDWIFVRYDNPNAGSLPAETVAPPDDFEEALERDNAVSDEFGRILVPDFGDTPFPGAAVPYDPGEAVPPPDCLGFYLPFHYFHPLWWGVYLIVEGIQGLASFVQAHSNDVLSYRESVVVSRLFVYGHEAVHHIVESFATRLEVSHRKALYRTGFDVLFRKYAGTPKAVEEALASAHGYRKVRERAFKRPNQPKRHKAALSAIGEYIRRCPPGYDRALEFINASSFVAARSAFAEVNHNWALPHIAPISARAWNSFPHAFSGISRVHSRVNYAVHRNSPLIKRIRTRGHYLRYREVTERLEKLASCTFVRQKGGAHTIWQNREGKHFPVPRHPGDINKGTLQKIIKQAGLHMSVSEFVSQQP